MQRCALESAAAVVANPLDIHTNDSRQMETQIFRRYREIYHFTGLLAADRYLVMSVEMIESELVLVSIAGQCGLAGLD